MWTWTWLGVVVVALLFEFLTMEMVSLWFGIGGIVALILSICGAGLEAQWIAFGLISILCIIFARKAALKLLSKDGEKKVTIKDLTIGNSYKLLSDITKTTAGTIKVNGVEWSVITQNDEQVKAGEMVEVVALVGNKYIVKKTKIVENKGE